MKILLIAGHGGKDPGACSSYGTEATETRRVVNQLKANLLCYNNVSVDVYNTSRDCYTDCGNGTLQVSFSNYNYVFEVHFNSATAAAKGTEIYVTRSESGTTVEQAVVNKIAALGFTNRGVKRSNFRVIARAKSAGVSSALLEVCFISNKDDMSRYNSKFQQVCDAISSGIAQGFGLTRKSTAQSNPVASSPSTPQTPAASTLYRVKTVEGKQLGAYRVLDNAKTCAKANNAIVYNSNGNVVVSYAPAATKTVAYRVKDSSGKQLGAYNVLEYAKSCAKSNKAIVYDTNNNVVVSYATVATKTTTYRVKDSSGKQLGAFNVLEYAKNCANSNKAIVYDANGNVVYSAVVSKRYLNLSPAAATWNVYPLDKAPVIKNSCGKLAPKQYGGLSYEILGNPQTDVYTIKTSAFGKVNIYAPRGGNSTITNSPVY